MVYNDEWGRDPSVQAMRKLFGKIEHSQYTFLGALKISFLDQRVRRWRERALVIFEKMYAYAAQRGIAIDEEKASDIYIFSLANVMNSENVKIPGELLSQNEDIKTIFKEAFK